MTTPETQPAHQTEEMPEDIHGGYGEDIYVYDADGREYQQPTCLCGAPLGMHLSLDEHRAQAAAAESAARGAAPVAPHTWAP